MNKEHEHRSIVITNTEDEVLSLSTRLTTIVHAGQLLPNVQNKLKVSCGKSGIVTARS